MAMAILSLIKANEESHNPTRPPWGTTWEREVWEDNWQWQGSDGWEGCQCNLFQLRWQGHSRKMNGQYSRSKIN